MFTTLFWWENIVKDRKYQIKIVYDWIEREWIHLTEEQNWRVCVCGGTTTTILTGQTRFYYLAAW